MKQLLTLVIITTEDAILLGMKKRGFGAGRWNGFGGKVEEGETIEEAARREVKEEISVSVGALEQVGIITFHFEDGPIPQEVHIFAAESFDGEPKESEEMRPEWFSQDAVPYEEMWPADREWLPLFLSGRKFRGDVYFADQNGCKEVAIRSVPHLS